MGLDTQLLQMRAQDLLVAPEIERTNSVFFTFITLISVPARLINPVRAFLGVSSRAP